MIRDKDLKQFMERQLQLERHGSTSLAPVAPIYTDYVVYLPLNSISNEPENK